MHILHKPIAELHYMGLYVENTSRSISIAAITFISAYVSECAIDVYTITEGRCTRRNVSSVGLGVAGVHLLAR